MLTALGVVASRLDDAGVRWLVSGGVGRVLMGFARRPHDLDIEVADADMSRAGAALGLVPIFEEGGGRAGRRAATHIRGVPVDLFSGLVVARADGHAPLVADFALQEEFAAQRAVVGRTVRVAPVEEQMAVAMVSADWDRLGRTVAGAPPGFRLRPAYFERRLSAADNAAS